MIALIDGDIVIYQIAYTNQKTVDWGDGEVDTAYDYPGAERALDNFIEDIRDAVTIPNAACQVRVLLSDKTNFRYDVDRSYKHNRVGTRKPELYKHVKDYLRENWKCMVVEGLEADDALGILTTGDTWRPGEEKVICSTDKDMLTIPGLHFNWRTPDVGVFRISKEQADRHFYMQILTGDSSDGYPGCPGIGPVKAAKALNAPSQFEWDHPWLRIVAQYELKGLTEDDALVQARLARILRAEDWDNDTKRPILWTPPKGETDDTGSR